jgi:hypothetical protein
MILIASGAYLQGEFASEVGLLPPSFLPIGNKRLYEYQVEFMAVRDSAESDIYISIPVSYQLDQFDEKRLSELNTKIIKVPDGLSLGDSLLYCWNATGKHHDSLTLLHGDTLFMNAYFQGKDEISVHANRGFYKRATLGAGFRTLEKVHDSWSNDCDQVISGYFRFSSPLFFMKSLVESKSDFVQAIVRYHQEKRVSLTSEGDWLDFGHINSFYHSRTQMTTQRAFNELTITKRLVFKASKNKSKKIYAEGSWFSNLPLPLRIYTPALLDLKKGDEEFNAASYQVEYLYLPPLSDIFVFSRLAKGCWQTIFKAISEMLQDFKRYKPNNIEEEFLNQIDTLYLPKTLNRLKEFSEQSGFDIDCQKFTVESGESYTLIEIAHLSSEHIGLATKDDISILHGDLCFSNLLFDNRVEAVKCIDPRGMTPDGQLSLFGDRRYDLAKLYHSVIGLYDMIIAGRYVARVVSDNECKIEFSLSQTLHEEVTSCFRREILEKSGYKEKEILAITVHLFLSMLPLHADHPQRQRAFLSNALRLFNQLRDIKQ